MTRRFLLTTVLTGAALSAADVEWRTYGGDKGFQRYSPLDQINKATLKDLEVAWTRPALDQEYRVEWTPKVRQPVNP